MPTQVRLKQDLQGWMIFFIVMSVVIGAGIFNNGGSSMRIAGPGGALLAFAIMSVIAISVSECISEMVQLFAVPNAIVEYVRFFIDEDLGWAIGIAYWLTYSSIFAAQNMMAAQLSEYWGGREPTQVYRLIVFYIIAPTVMLVINILGVSIFGWIESIGGALKVALVLGTTFALYVMAGMENNNCKFYQCELMHLLTQLVDLQDGFQHNPVFVSNNVAAVCYVIPIMAFGFIGIETIAVTAFEAAPRSLRWPSKFITYITAFVYLICMLSQCFNIQWINDHLPMAYGGVQALHRRATEDPKNPYSRVLAIIAMYNWEKKDFAGFLNGAIIFSVLSASNTTLYVASRTLYGMSVRVKDSSRFGKLVRILATVDQRSGVPLHALFLSWAMFIWVPFMSLKNDYRVQYVVEIIQIAASVSCLIVWTALCVAYLRLWYWQMKFDSTDLLTTVRNINGEDSRPYEIFRRDPSIYTPHTVLMALQPIPAILAITGCLITFVFCSATWWYREADFPKVAIAYAAQFIVLTIWVILKSIRVYRMTSKDRRHW